jgi:hypothetical protein
MPEKRTSYNLELPAAKAFALIVNTFRSAPGVDDFSFDIRGMTAAWRTGKGWFSSSFLTADSARMTLSVTPLTQIQSQVHIGASSFKLFDWDDYLDRTIQRAASAIASAIETIRQHPVRPVFLSYRRKDSGDAVGRIYDRLVQHLGIGNVFHDVQNIPIGANFVATIAQLIAQSKLCLPVIGERWLAEADEDANSDYVFLEIQAALMRTVPLLPVLIGNGSMPKQRDLPAEIRSFAQIQAFRIRPDPHFHEDISTLLGHIEQFI